MADPAPPPRAARRPAHVAAVLVALVVVPAVVAWGALDGEPASPGATRAGPPVALVPAGLPDGLRFEHARETTWPRSDQGYVVYGPAAGGDQAARTALVAVSGPTCCEEPPHPVATVRGRAARSWWSGDGPVLAWEEAGSHIEVQGSTDVTAAELARIAEQLVVAPAPPSGLPPGRASGSTVVARAGWLPRDLVLLWDGATLPPGTEIPVATWSLTDGRGGWIELVAWRGVPDAALWEIHEPIGAASSEVRDRPAVIEIHDGGSSTVWWVEGPGLVVRVGTVGGTSTDELLALVEDLRPVDAGGWATFAAAAPLPPTVEESVVATSATTSTAAPA